MNKLQKKMTTPHWVPWSGICYLCIAGERGSISHQNTEVLSLVIQSFTLDWNLKPHEVLSLSHNLLYHSTLLQILPIVIPKLLRICLLLLNCCNLDLSGTVLSSPENLLLEGALRWLRNNYGFFFHHTNTKLFAILWTCKFILHFPAS